MTTPTNEEVFLPIPGFDDYYSVSNLGRVKSHARTVERSDGKPLPVKEKLLTPQLSEQGHPQVSLFIDNVAHRFSLAQLVMNTFTEFKPKAMVIAHRDSDVSNCALYNLYWETKSKMNLKKNLKGTMSAGEKHPKSKLKETQAKAIKQLEKMKPAELKLLAKVLGVTQTCINSVLKGKTWKSV